MNENSKQNVFGILLRKLLEEKSLSMRKLSELTEIDTATISRIINGKRKANLHHMQQFADSLDVPVTRLMEAAGYQANKNKAEPTLANEGNSTFQTLKTMLETSNIYEYDFSMKKINQQIVEYQEYSQTEQGKKTILTQFNEKLKKVGSIGPYINHLEEMFSKFKSHKGSPHELALMGSALIYFIFMIDLVPDYIFPIGYLDDAIVVQTVIQSLRIK
ncbi:DUF1232 domain-containing protein [Oceanobacillus damuensis]|uniref:DUF1232 domain-containing protein n=1 Tax=Oceanobacillus damuensis TaxID=937928 RepID=UPI00082E04FF|nr:DUF1232 domain-containing protein [Oceanobacillus damuensis]